MTAKTNTGSKLAGSLRRAKNQTTDATDTTASKPAVPKAAPKKAPAKKPAAKPAVSKKEEAAPAPVKRFARRVWPD